ncbi:MAG: hypothetical protein GY788_19655, partial [bacterium]|nr:hypothetical protein [bacterium]
TDQGIVKAHRIYETPYDSVAPEGPESIFVEADLDQIVDALDRLTTAASA